MHKQMWEIKQQAEGSVSLYIYGDVEGDGYDFWSGDVIESETSANHFREELAKYPNARQIDIYINSYGGSVFEGTAIYNQLRRHPAHKTVYIDGFACSVASVIAMAGDTVVMPKNALMMIHNMWMCAAGNASELRKAADDLDTINEAGRSAYLEKAGGRLDAEKLAEMMDSETWLTAQQCIELGLADEYAEKDADMTNAPKVLGRAAADIEQRINVCRALSAQLRALSETPEQKEKTETKPTGIIGMLAGL